MSTFPALKDAGDVAYESGRRWISGRRQIGVQLLGVDTLRQGSAVSLAGVAPEPAMRPAEILAPVAPGEQFAFGGGVGCEPQRRDEGGRGLLVALGEGEAL